MENGFIVLDEADSNKTVDWTVCAKMNNTGECSVAAKRFIVVEELADLFMEKFEKAVDALQAGDPMPEALRTEVEPLGISVSVVEPSGFRTDWAGRSANENRIQMDAYAATADMGRSQLLSISGKQEGDPVRAAHAIIKVIGSAKPPHHLLLGNAAYEGAMAKLDELRGDFAALEAVSRSADFPQENQAG